VGRLGEARVVELDPYGSSSYCSRCGWENNRDLNGADIFVCGGCGLRINRQLNAAINLYMRMRLGCTVSWVGGRKRVELRHGGRFPAAGVVGPRGSTLPLLGGCVLTRGGGAE